MTEAARVKVADRLFDRGRLARLADCLAIAVAVSLPWSTSATGILIFLWLLAVLPTVSPAEVRRELANPAAGLAVALWALGIVGMAWGEGSFAERLYAIKGFHKLLVIPLLLILVMIFRPMGLIAFKDLDVRTLLRPKRDPGGET